MFSTADLYDQHFKNILVLEPNYRNFGGLNEFHGKVFTIKAFEDNSLVREHLEQQGHQRVMVVDGGGSLRCAMLGDNLAQLAIDNDWAGLVINGCVRDSKILKTLSIGIKATNTHPRKSVKKGEGQINLDIEMSGQVICPNHYIYSDEDGIIIANKPLL